MSKNPKNFKSLGREQEMRNPEFPFQGMECQSDEKIHGEDEENEIREKTTDVDSYYSDDIAYHQTVPDVVRNFKDSSKNNSVASKREKKEQEEQPTCTVPEAAQTNKSGSSTINRIHYLIGLQNEAGMIVEEAENEHLSSPIQTDLESNIAEVSGQEKVSPKSREKVSSKLVSLMNLVRRTKNSASPRIEPYERAQSCNMTMEEGVSKANITAHLPVIGDKRILASAGLQKSSSNTSIEYIKETIAAIERDTYEFLKQKTPESEVVSSSEMKSEHQSLQRDLWLYNEKDEDCLFVEKRRKLCRVLVYGDFIAQRITTIAQAGFKQSLYQSLSRIRYREPMRIQSYAWPALMKGYDLVMVNPPRSGKTLGYLVPIISRMLTPAYYAELPEGNGPLVLILCPSWATVKQTYVYCNRLLSNIESSVIVIPTYGGLEMKQTVPLINGCHILISTPRCYLRLLRRDRITTDLDRLCYLIFDEADTLMELFLPEVREMLKECNLLHQRRAERACQSSEAEGARLYKMVKIIAAAKRWCPEMEEFVTKVVEKPMLCIGSYLEAAVYARLKPKLHLIGFHMSKEAHQTDTWPLLPEKVVLEIDDVVLRVIKETVGRYKIAVVCESVVDIERLAPKMKFVSDLLIIQENMLHTEIESVLCTWKCMEKYGTCPVLLISDNILPEVEIGDVQHLVHVGIPSSSKTQFGLRFSTMMENYRDIFAKKIDLNEENESRSCFVDIIVDLTKPNVEISGLIEFLQRLGMDIPPELNAISSKLLIRKESMKKKDVVLCHVVKSFGKCAMPSCKYRHVILPDVDKPAKGIPSSGRIRVKILHALDPSTFSVRLQEIVGNDGQNTLYFDDYYEVASGLSRHFGKLENRFRHGEPKIGDICALEVDNNLFARAVVEDVFYSDSNSWKPVGVMIYLIDQGKRFRTEKCNLLYLPENLKKYPAQSKELIVCRLLPRDLDTSWSEEARMKIGDLVDEANLGEKDGKYVIGNVVLTLGNTIWVDRLECREWLKYQKTSIIHFSIRRDLIRDGLAVDNPDHMPRLKKLCENLDLSSSPAECELDGNSVLSSTASSVNMNQPTEVVTQSEVDNHSLLPDWEILDPEQIVEVNVVNVDNPHNFSVQKAASSEKISLFYEEIESWVENVWKNSSFKNGKEIVVGSFCLGYFESEGCWNRAKVLNVMKPNGNEQMKMSRDLEKETLMYEVYFVDYGEKVTIPNTEVIPIPESFITQLPFQAIECALVDICPIITAETDSEEWNDAAGDEFYKFCRCDNLIDYQPLLAKVFGVERIDNYSGSKYLIALYEKQIAPNLPSIGRILVERGLANPFQSIPNCEAGSGLEDLVNNFDWNWSPDTSLIQPVLETQDVQSSDESNRAKVPVERDWSHIPDDALSQQSEDSFDIVMSDDELIEMTKKCGEMVNLYAGFPGKEGEVIFKKVSKGVSPDGEDFSSYRNLEEVSQESIEAKSGISSGRFEDAEAITEEIEGHDEIIHSNMSAENLDEKENLHCLLENKEDEKTGLSKEMSNLQISAVDEVPNFKLSVAVENAVKESEMNLYPKNDTPSFTECSNKKTEVDEEADVQKGIADVKSGNESTKEDPEPPPRLLPIIRAAVKWSQTKLFVILKIHLPNMDRYRPIWESNRELYIYAVSDTRKGQPHMAHFYFWGYVDVPNSKFISTSEDTLQVIMCKAHRFMEWPRLLDDPVKPNWLSVDFDLLEFDTEEADEEVPKKLVPHGNRDDEILSEDGSEEIGDEERCEEVNYDPYDPFS